MTHASRFIPLVVAATLHQATGCGDNAIPVREARTDLTRAWCEALFCDLPQYIDGCAAAHLRQECEVLGCEGSWPAGRESRLDMCLVALADWAAECGQRHQPPFECLGLFEGWGRP